MPMEFKDLTNQVLHKYIYIFKSLQLKLNDKFLRHKTCDSATVISSSLTMTVTLIKLETT